MISIESRLTGKRFSLQELEEKLKPQGYVIGGNWDYDHGSFDYQIEEGGAYIYLRLPFTAVKGALDERGTEVELNQPFLLAHEYQNGIAEEVRGAGMVNQFQEPIDQDADIPNRYFEIGQRLVEKLEQTLLYDR